MSERIMRCSKCGTKNKSTNKYCENCGAFLYGNLIESLVFSIFDPVLFIFGACIIALFFAALNLLLFNITNDSLIYRMFYYIQTEWGIVIGICFIAGLIIMVFSRNDAKLKRIEKMLKEIQQDINR